MHILVSDVTGLLLTSWNSVHSKQLKDNSINSNNNFNIRDNSKIDEKDNDDEKEKKKLSLAIFRILYNS